MRPAVTGIGTAWMVGGPAPPLMQGTADKLTRQTTGRASPAYTDVMGASNQGTAATLGGHPPIGATPLCIARLGARTPANAPAYKPNVKGRVPCGRASPAAASFCRFGRRFP